VNRQEGELRVPIISDCEVLTNSSGRGRLRGGGESNQDLPPRPPPTPRLAPKTVSFVRLEELNVDADIDSSSLDPENIKLIADTSGEHILDYSL
jgi:hypothetical protein